jgi:two-component system chemotaxis sensor kinase CheA
VREKLEASRSALAELRAAASELRLVPASTIAESIERAARDAAIATGKSARVRFSGGEIGVDAHVLASVEAALLQLVRNAVAHGIETSEIRLRRGKAAEGAIDVAVRHAGSRVRFTVRDDGGGIDRAAVLRAAVQRGYVPAAATDGLDVEQVFQLLLRGGLSTTTAVTQLSGRGVGLELVRDAIQGVRGAMTVASTAGQSTCFEIDAPVSSASIVGVVVEAAGQQLIVPSDAVLRTLRRREADIVRVGDRLETLDGSALLPFGHLGAALGAHDGAVRAVLILTSESSRVAVGVDRVRGIREVEMQPLPPPLPSSGLVAGVAVGETGEPTLVLDPKAVVAWISTQRVVQRPAITRPSPILIVDDSLTTRMLEQSILESAGYEVALATSAEDALEQVKTAAFSLFLVDVEMPAIDGFELVRRLKADAATREVPAILVTSRDAPDDRRRGHEVGARGYVVKGQFDQRFLLGLIRQLVVRP